ncbi:MAG: hypothetical protein WA584_03465 [Pyrinomonadaceae bacterium]
MDVAVIETSVFNPTNLPPAHIAAEDESVPTAPAPDTDELIFELGFWFSGLESFLNIRNHSFADESRAKATSRDWAREFRLTHSTLLLCSRLTIQLGKALKKQKSENDLEDFSMTSEEIFKLSAFLKDAVLLNEGLLRAAPLRFGEWTAWSNSLSDKLKSSESIQKLISSAEKTGENSLPTVLRDLLENRQLPFAIEADLRLVLPRFAKILRWLGVIEKMLGRDEPLKPTLLIFSRIYEQIREMMSYINNRLLRFSNEDDALFGVLDGASYAASIELRKVYNYELAGLAEIRQSPLIYAKIETAFALLNDSFQLTLVNFAQLIDPNVEPFKLFPSIKIKFDQSVILREDLWSILQEVKKSEENPDKNPLAELHRQLTDFSKGTLHFLFYKDKETVERFIEEVLITTNKKDLVPILHRFGAYLETLFGQVNMRIVLAGNPFEYPQE